MPSWNDAVTRRVEDTAHHHDAMEMEPLNPPRQDHHRVPSPGRFNSPGQMGVPPIRTGASAPGYFPASSPYDEQRQYDHGASGPYETYHTSPYDRSYHDYPPEGYSQPAAQIQVPYSSQPRFSPMPASHSPSSDMPYYTPYRQPSPGLSGTTQPPSYRALSPAGHASPPPPFSAVNPVPLQVSDPGRPPSLLQSGRKPAPNSYRDV
ncbi:uncharacterized protein ACLA_082410 [Aspergillus clavatus NRRL 1]|uniref:Uncharacterized protein n=1 Tax=Aspergillus clavatus (strain ATCC 1007 / CBS 513.65 / DSM 816 / NCTC 3887 / NRRL 1 / QM 1276 / 107) TaxID=344612 RepID=A1CTB3_ASPCL|nr:uncharacterized protein ACLA_082410 [Aspergillus clavatus NRRL 1]EAW06550.1 conserved hypothetical protein [Aspergillus clavatus NRRL 1]